MPSDCCFYVDTNEFLYAAYLQFETFKQTLTVIPRQTMSLLKFMKTLRWRSGDFTGLNDIIERKMMPVFSWVILCLRKYSIVFKRNVCIYSPTVIWTNNTTYIVKKIGNQSNMSGFEIYNLHYQNKRCNQYKEWLTCLCLFVCITLE